VDRRAQRAAADRFAEALSGLEGEIAGEGGSGEGRALAGAVARGEVGDRRVPPPAEPGAPRQVSLLGKDWDPESDARMQALPSGEQPRAFGSFRRRVETRDYALNRKGKHTRPDFEALRKDPGATLEYVKEALKDIEADQDEGRRTEPFPWEGVASHWQRPPAGDEEASPAPPYLPPWEADGHDSVNVGKMNMFTGDAAGKGTYYTDPLYTRLQSLVQQGSTGEDLSAYDAYRLRRRYARKMTLQTAHNYHKLREMTYTQLWQLAAHGCVASVKPTMDQRAVWVQTNDSCPGGERREKVNVPYDPDLVQHLRANGVDVLPAREPTAAEDALVGCVRLFVPLLAAGLLIKVYDELEGLLSKGDSSFELIDPASVGTSFDDVAGIDEVKDEVLEVVEFLRNPRQYLEMGIKTPTGVLLAGPPGTGKTLLARAICGEAGVPLINASSDDFQNEYVGVGAALVRNLFEMARNAAPCVVFIDEFDSLGYRREYTAGSQNMQTINQLLTEMDGFTDNSGVVVLAATNRVSMIDKALLRPGRFDRVLNMPLPNVEGRVEILEVHSRKLLLGPDVDLRVVAKAAPGFTGAMLMGLMSVSAMNALREERSEVGMRDILTALDEVQAERSGQSLDNRARLDTVAEDPLARKHLAVVHVAQALVNCILPGAPTLIKIDLSPATTSFVTYSDPPELVETKIYSRGYAENKMAILMAGVCAERLALGSEHVSAAAAKDQQFAAAIAREMVTQLGYGEHVGQVVLPQSPGEVPGLQAALPSEDILHVSGNLAQVVLYDIETLCRAAEAKAYYALARNWKVYQRLLDTVLEDGFMLGSTFTQILAEEQAFVFPTQSLSGFGFDEAGGVVYPDMTSWRLQELSEKQRLLSYGNDEEGAAGSSEFKWPKELVQDAEGIAALAGGNGAAGGGNGVLEKFKVPDSLYRGIPQNLVDLLPGRADAGDSTP